MPNTSSEEDITKPISLGFDNISRILLIIVVLSLALGVGTGYILAQKPGTLSKNLPISETPKTAEQDTKTFRDFAEGTLRAKETPKSGEYTEGTHVLIRDGAVPVALTSSVVDLSKYESKKVKVYGETQKALSEGWLMDVGKVEEIK